MRRAIPVITVTAGGLALIAGFHTTTTGASATTAPGATQVTTSTTAASPGSSASPTTLTPTAPRSINGPVITTKYGPVQVRVTLTGTRLTDAQALQLPSDRSRSARISQTAGPQLRSEALQAQSANIHLVSGATYTSQGYISSLQGAINLARG